MSSPSRDIEDRVRALLEETLELEGFDLVAVVHTTADGQRTLRVHIDKPGGVTVGDCTRVTRMVSPVMDVEDPIVGAYRLEVSSPGIDRPLQRLSDFERFAGTRAVLRLEPGAGPRKLRGVLRGVEDGDVLVERTDHVRRVPFEAIERANLILDLDEYRALSELGDKSSPSLPRHRATVEDGPPVANEQESSDDQ
jgi:ribosome maturation factor RimP